MDTIRPSKVGHDLRKPIALGFIAVVVTLIASAAPATEPTNDADSYTMFYDGLVDGHLVGGIATVPRPADTALSRSAMRSAQVETLQNSGPPANRIDVVFLGDGYTAAELDTYRDEVDAAVEEMFGISPFSDYRDAFNIYRVDVASAQSGVDNDPDGTYRNTAFDATYWCSGTDRLICANYSKMHTAALLAPAVDYMILLVNSDTYGGGGGPYTVAAGGNLDRALTIEHENGHTFGGLFDEYFYGSGAYSGPAINGPNCSTSTKVSMATNSKAWFAWLDEDDAATGGIVGAFEGCNYYGSGIYRPTKNSIMRDLGYPYFNSPSTEALVLSFYQSFKPADDALTVVPVAGWIEVPWVGDSTHLAVDWKIDGVVIDGEHGIGLDFGGLGLGPGPHRVEATVTDQTPLVRNEALRTLRMKVKVDFWVDDTIYYCGGRQATIVGTPDPDVIDGTSGDDVIVGLGGGDTINGYDGQDRICGGAGADEIFGGAGKDRLYGGTSGDVLHGGGNDDRLFGNGGDDSLFGDGGNDRAKGGPGTDTCVAETASTCE